MSLRQMQDLIRTELTAHRALPDELRADLEQALETLELYSGKPAPEPEPPRQEAAKTLGVGVGQDGFLQVHCRNPEYAGYARTMQDLLNLLQGRPIGGLAAALVEIAARVDALEMQVQGMTPERRGQDDSEG